MDDPLLIRPVKQDGRSSAASATSSRAAANLSLERLYRKRAIDRENQRVLREKNKARLAELESEVRTLTARLEQAEASHSVHSAQAAHAAQSAQAARSQVAQTAARAQSSSSSLGAIIASLQSLQVSLGELGELGALGDAAAALSATSDSGGDNSRTSSVAVSIASTTPGSSPVASASPVFTPSAPAAAMAAPATSRSSISTTVPSLSPSPASNAGTPKGGHTPYELSDRVMTGASEDVWSRPGASVTVVDDSTPRNGEFSVDIDLLTRHLPLADEPDSKQARSLSTTSSASAYTFRNSIASTASSAPPLPAQPTQSAQTTAEAAVYQAARVEANRLRHAVGTSPVWAVTPSYVPPTSSMDELLSLRGRAANAGLHASRLPPIQTAGTGAGDGSGLPPLASVHSLLSPLCGGPLSQKSLPGLPPSLSSFAEAQPSSSAIAHHVASTITAFNTPERTALLYTVCIYLRWLIAPSQGHYDAIPDFLRPTAAQLVVPHAFWVDTIAWPLARDRLITHLDYTHSHAFFAILARTFSINWPHSLDGILQRGEGSSEHLVVSPAFVQHVRDPANWSVGSELVDAFPFLDGAVSVRR